MLYNDPVVVSFCLIRLKTRKNCIKPQRLLAKKRIVKENDFYGYRLLGALRAPKKYRDELLYMELNVRS